MGRLKSNRKGWEKIKKKLLRFDQRELDVGFFRDKKYGPDNDNMYVAEVAYINDQGNRDVPPRPFMTVDFDQYVSKNFNSIAKEIFSNLLNTSSTALVKDLKTVGSRLEGILSTIIYDYPGSNSPDWAEHKGFNDPLFYTGVLVTSVASRVRNPRKTEDK